MISQIPGRRGRAVELARGAMADLDAVDFARDPGRPLGQTAREYAGVIARARTDALVEHYQLLAEAGFEEESLDVLEAATAESAEPELFRRLAELRLGRGDTAGAALAFAVVASDPGTLRGEARALARRAGHAADSPEWRRLLDSATAEWTLVSCTGPQRFKPAAHAGQRGRCESGRPSPSSRSWPTEPAVVDLLGTPKTARPPPNIHRIRTSRTDSLRTTKACRSIPSLHPQM